jgi:putative transposase
MNDVQSLSHTLWECKYHLVWIPKYRRKVLFGDIRKHLGGVLRELAIQRQSNILEGHLMKDHLHMLISIPPKYSVAQVVGFMKGKNFWRAQAELYGSALLGKGIFRFNGWQRRDGQSAVHQDAGTRRPQARSIGYV